MVRVFALALVRPYSVPNLYCCVAGCGAQVASGWARLAARVLALALCSCAAPAPCHTASPVAGPSSYVR